MIQKENILQELNELKSSLATVTPQNVYTVPVGYFDGLVAQVLSRIKAVEAKNAVEEGKMKIEWGSQIRSYVLHPYKTVNDHRTELKITDAEGVLDGNIDELLKTFLMSQGKRK